MLSPVHTFWPCNYCLQCSAKHCIYQFMWILNKHLRLIDQRPAQFVTFQKKNHFCLIFDHKTAPPYGIYASVWVWNLFGVIVQPIGKHNWAGCYVVGWHDLRCTQPSSLWSGCLVLKICAIYLLYLTTLIIPLCNKQSRRYHQDIFDSIRGKKKTFFFPVLIEHAAEHLFKCMT